MIPPEVLSLPGVADHLSQALHMMNRLVGGMNFSKMESGIASPNFIESGL